MGRADALKPGRRKDDHPPLARSELPTDTAALARYLIGKLLVRELPEGVASGHIVETEAYVVGDAAGHAYGGMTRRNRSLFLERGHAYVYLAYGISDMLNVSSETPGIGAGVLIRALEPLLLPMFKKGAAPHVNNVELGRRGRWRSNLWAYPGASSLGSDARRGLKDHPTVKPTAMLEDAFSPSPIAATSSLTRSSAPARPSSPQRKPVAFVAGSNSTRSTSM
jgi:3-methyladenine DNA glycosylase Mpg